MGDRRNSWRETFTALGESLVEVLRAELAVLAEGWKRSGRELGIAIALVVAAGYVALICLPTLLIIALAAGLHALGLPLWGAALVVAAVVMLVIGLMAWIAVKRLERCENPVAAAKDRFSDHVAWWQESILMDDRTLGAADGSQDDAGDGPAEE